MHNRVLSYSRLFSALVFTYPFFIFYFYRAGAPEYAKALLILIVAHKASTLLSTSTTLRRVGILLVLISLIALLQYPLLSTSPLYLPVLINAALFVIFIGSFFQKETVIERIATKMRSSPLPPEAILHCRKACIAWSIFFLCNGTIALDSINRSIEWWSLYNGVISYCLMGLLFGIEYFYRRRVTKIENERNCTSNAGTFRGVTLFFSLFLYPSFLLLTLNNLRAEEIHHEDQLPIRIQKALTPPYAFRSHYTEKKYISVLSAPIASSGILSFLPTRGLLLKMEKPFTRLTVITPHAVRQGKDKDHLEGSSDYSGMSQALLSLMNGEIRATKEHFTLKVLENLESNQASPWRLNLTPRDSLVSEVITSLSIEGAEHPTQIDVTHSNGDKVVTIYAPPEKLSDTEARELLQLFEVQ